ncbi:hypothetical protein [Kitasatospora sp. MBT63]|uniref:hypothetical protein n=1 Tax=Kitasatospora sp. MBT63 TaxID=1444768 RepID=UPI00053A6851|nr:hypothetical protein [Kitasatospora sp. MBT63]
MLSTRRALAGIGAVIAVLLGFLATPALADGGANCPPFVLDCTVNAGGGGTTGGTGGGGGGGGNNGGGGGSGGVAKCHAGEREVPCYRDGLGWFNSFDSCYYTLMDPQPPADDPIWTGPIAAQAKAYMATCPYSTAPTTNPGGMRILSTPPPGFGGPAVDPRQLAETAVENMRLQGADIGIAPKQGGVSLVGLPVWLWTAVSDTTWGPKSTSVSAGGVTVTATAKVDKIAWSMGDGTTEVCRTPGEAYDPSYGTRTPSCGHTYTKVSGSSPYKIDATSTWIVTWTSNTGQGGTITTTRASSTTAAIAELQTVNR